jgi:hypothetical protein
MGGHHQFGRALFGACLELAVGILEFFFGLDPIRNIAGGALNTDRTAGPVDQRGYADEDIRLILGGNFMRVFEKVLK